MAVLLAGLILFLGVHSLGIVAHAWRDRMRARLGDKAWKGLYSLVAVVGLVLVIYGYGAARQEPVVVYAPPLWLSRVAALLLLPVFPLLFAAYLPGRIRTELKHPLLLGVMFWAAAHLLANGTLGDLLLFGGFLLWAVADRLSFAWWPPQNIRTAPSTRANDALAITLGLGVYLLFGLGLHEFLFGVPALGA
jgi:uncharacterized membrane protein